MDARNERPVQPQNEQSLLVYQGSNIAFEKINGKIYPKDDWVKYLGGLIFKNDRYEE